MVTPSGGVKIFIHRGHKNFDNKKKIEHKIQQMEEWNNSTKLQLCYKIYKYNLQFVLS
jgi:hypothetical protein